MNVLTRGMRNAFRNSARSISIIVILGLAIGLSLVMLIARQAVANKIDSVNSSIGNTVTITPAGFSNFSAVNNALTTNQLSKVTSLNHVLSLDESLTDRLTTIGSAASPFGQSSASANNQTSLTSPVKIRLNRQNGFGPSLFISGGGVNIPSNFSPPISIIGTTNINQINGINLSLSSGQFINGKSNANNAMISAAMASKNNLKVGSTFTAYGQNLNVSGIFTSNGNGLANFVVVPLPTEQRLSGQSNDVTSAIATIDSLANLNQATNEIKQTLGSSADVISASQEAANVTSPLNNIKSITLYSLIGALVAGIVIIFLIMIMIVRERRREIGVLKAIGASNLKVILQFISEAITLTLAGAVIGILIGVAAANPITHTLVNNAGVSTTAGLRHFGGGGFRAIASGSGNFRLNEARTGPLRGLRNSFGNIQAVVGWSVVVYGIIAAVLIAMIGSLLSSFLIAKIRPAEVMRVE